MRHLSICAWIIAIGGIGCAAHRASGPATLPAAPATTRRAAPPAVISPEVHPDRTVTFRLRAPAAGGVVVSGEWPGDERALAKDKEDVWSTTLGPLEPGIYGYSFMVDGLRMTDQANSGVKPMRSPTTSILEIPGNPPLPSEFTAVPHGTVRMHWYQSKSLGIRRGLCVYTPPDYERKPDVRYPVLYLFHGRGDNEATWTVFGKAHWIMDNLIASGKAKPMVVVMTDGQAFTAPPGFAGDERAANIDAFGRDLLGDVMPFVEANYRVQNNPQGRAIVGLSMGGAQSLTIGLNHPELFAWVGGFSSAVYEPQTSLASVWANPTAVNDKYRLIWIACGKDDALVRSNRQLSTLLNEKGIRHELVITEGNHSWPVWRRYLTQFVPLLFGER